MRASICSNVITTSILPITGGSCKVISVLQSWRNECCRRFYFNFLFLSSIRWRHVSFSCPQIWLVGDVLSSLHLTHRWSHGRLLHRNYDLSIDDYGGLVWRWSLFKGSVLLILNYKAVPQNQFCRGEITPAKWLLIIIKVVRYVRQLCKFI